MPNCEICGKELEIITHTHLKRHDLKNGGVPWNKGKKLPPAWNKGKKMLEISGDKNPAKRLEVRKKISEALKRRVLSEEALRSIQKVSKDPERNKKISEALEGRRLTDEHKEKLRKSAKESYKRGRVTWIRGLTKETDERVAKMARAMKGKEIPWREKLNKSIREGYRNGRTAWNKGLMKETDERVARYAKGLMGHISFYPKLYYVPELGHKVRSTYEEEVGLILKRAGIHYDYEGKVYKFDGTSYRPDFPITENLVVEAKGYFADWQREKYKRFREAYPEIALIIVGGAEGEDLSEYCNIHIPWGDREKLGGAVLSEL